METALVPPAPGLMPAVIMPPKPTSPKPVAIKDPAPVAGAAPIILFGRDANGRSHGASLIGDTAAVERAADLMDLYCFPADTEALRNLAAMLPTGRLFPASGKAFVPFVKGTLYDQLLATTGTREAPTPVKAAGKAAEVGGGAGGQPNGASGGSGAGDPPATRVGAKAPSDHSQIRLGSLVLADDEEEGYYAARVVLTKANDHFVLQWADYPDLPQFSRSRRELALLHPEAAAELA